VARQGNSQLGGITNWPILGKLAARPHPAGPLSGQLSSYSQANTRIGNQRKDFGTIKFFSHLLMTQMYVWTVHVL